MLLLALAAPALAYESVPAELLFVDDFDVFEAVEYDSGPIPSGSQVALQFTIESKGRSYAEIEATSGITWPDALTHELLGHTAGGYYELLTDIELHLDLLLDFGDLYKGRIFLWEDELYLDDEATFDGLLLKNSAPPRVDTLADGTGIDTLRFPLSIVTGLSLEVKLDVFPRASSTLTGTRIETKLASEGDVTVLDEEGALRFVDVPAENPGEVALTSTWYGHLSAALDVVLKPAADVCLFGSCWNAITLELPITLAGTDEERAFVPQDYIHPLPSIDVPLSAHDFGEVLLGNLSNLEVPITNVGKLPLEGTARVEGSDRISVFPEYFMAGAGATDGVVLTFAPDAILDTSAKLVIESNDPVRPVIEIPLLGAGYEPEPPEVDDGDADSQSIRTCGCASSPTPTPAFGPIRTAAFGLVGALVLLLRRRAR